MKTVIVEETIEGFGKNVKQCEIEEMKVLVNETKILNVFNDQNNIFGDKADEVHIDARYLPDHKVYKIDVQRKEKPYKTIGIAFITEAVKKEIEATDPKELVNICHGLYVNVINALECSMKEIIDTQTDVSIGTSRKYVICTNDGR